MAGHSQFKNIMHRKGAQDAKRAKVFAKIAREIMVSAKSGLPDPQFNPRLRAAMMAARAVNMPRDNIDRALKKALGGEDNTHFEEVRYEGYGPQGTAIIVEALTDNRNRTASEMRAAFSKYGGNLGETGSVSFLFEKIGLLSLEKNAGISFEALFEEALLLGAEDVKEEEDVFEVVTSVDGFVTVREGLFHRFGDHLIAQLIWRPLMPFATPGEGEEGDELTQKMIKLVDLLEDNEDVQHVYTNFIFPH